MSIFNQLGDIVRDLPIIDFHGDIDFMPMKVRLDNQSLFNNNVKNSSKFIINKF